MVRTPAEYLLPDERAFYQRTELLWRIRRAGAFRVPVMIPRTPNIVNKTPDDKVGRVVAVVVVCALCFLFLYHLGPMHPLPPASHVVRRILYIPQNNLAHAGGA